MKKTVFKNKQNCLNWLFFDRKILLICLADYKLLGMGRNPRRTSLFKWAQKTSSCVLPIDKYIGLYSATTKNDMNDQSAMCIGIFCNKVEDEI